MRRDRLNSYAAADSKLLWHAGEASCATESQAEIHGSFMQAQGMLRISRAMVVFIIDSVLPSWGSLTLFLIEACSR